MKKQNIKLIESTFPKIEIFDSNREEKFTRRFEGLFRKVNFEKLGIDQTVVNTKISKELADYYKKVVVAAQMEKNTNELQTAIALRELMVPYDFDITTNNTSLLPNEKNSTMLIYGLENISKEPYEPILIDFWRRATKLYAVYELPKTYVIFNNPIIISYVTSNSLLEIKNRNTGIQDKVKPLGYVAENLGMNVMG